MSEFDTGVTQQSCRLYSLIYLLFVLPNASILNELAGSLLWVKLRKTQCEQMFSGVPLEADVDVWQLRDCGKTPGRSTGVMRSHSVW
jgi:hypothetical protein